MKRGCPQAYPSTHRLADDGRLLDTFGVEDGRQVTVEEASVEFFQCALRTTEKTIIENDGLVALCENGNLLPPTRGISDTFVRECYSGSVAVNILVKFSAIHFDCHHFILPSNGVIPKKVD